MVCRTLELAPDARLFRSGFGLLREIRIAAHCQKSHQNRKEPKVGFARRTALKRTTQTIAAKIRGMGDPESETSLVMPIRNASFALSILLNGRHVRKRLALHSNSRLVHQVSDWEGKGVAIKWAAGRRSEPDGRPKETYLNRSVTEEAPRPGPFIRHLRGGAARLLAGCFVAIGYLKHTAGILGSLQRHPPKIRLQAPLPSHDLGLLVLKKRDLTARFEQKLESPFQYVFVGKSFQITQPRKKRFE